MFRLILREYFIIFIYIQCHSVLSLGVGKRYDHIYQSPVTHLNWFMYLNDCFEYFKCVLNVLFSTLLIDKAITIYHILMCG